MAVSGRKYSKYLNKNLKYFTFYHRASQHKNPFLPFMLCLEQENKVHFYTYNFYLIKVAQNLKMY